MLIKIRYPNHVSVLIVFVFCSWIINAFEINISKQYVGWVHRVNG